MEIKVIPKVVQTTVYITSDGKEYFYQGEAILHEEELKVESLFGITHDDLINGIEDIYIIISSKDELDLLRAYLYDVCGWDYTNCNWDNVEFPVLSVFNMELKLDVVSEKVYEECKHVCEMYEKMLSLKQSKQ